MITLWTRNPEGVPVVLEVVKAEKLVSRLAFFRRILAEPGRIIHADETVRA